MRSGGSIKPIVEEYLSSLCIQLVENLLSLDLLGLNVYGVIECALEVKGSSNCSKGEEEVETSDLYK
jgi:hypothetical protein